MSNVYIFPDQGKRIVSLTASPVLLTADQLYCNGITLLLTNVTTPLPITLPLPADMVDAHERVFGSCGVDPNNTSTYTFSLIKGAAGLFSFNAVAGVTLRNTPSSTALSGTSLVCTVVYTNVTAGAEAYEIFISGQIPNESVYKP